MDKKLFELGLSKRRSTLGSDYVNKNLDLQMTLIVTFKSR